MKKHQRGSVALIVLGVIAAVLIIVIGMAVSIRNSYTGLENGIVAADQSRQTTLSNLSQKVKEVIGIRSMSVDDIKATVNEQIHARSGDKNPIVNMVREQNIAPSPEMYTKIINIIDSGRAGFLQSEKMLIDRKRVACDTVRKFPHGMILGFFGLPHLHTGCDGDTDDFKVLLNSNASESFKTGEDKGLY
jgi:hypothetical protein